MYYKKKKNKEWKTKIYVYDIMLNGNNVDEEGFPNRIPGEVTKFSQAKITPCDVERRSRSKYKNILRSNRRFVGHINRRIIISRNARHGVNNLEPIFFFS